MESVIVEFVGELDVVNASQVRDALDSAASCEAVAVDLSQVSYLDSTLLSGLVRLRRMRQDAGRPEPVRIYGAGALARRIFSITRLDELFELAQPGERPPRAQARTLVLGGSLPRSASADEFLDVMRRIVGATGISARSDEADGVTRWTYANRQVQAHCISDEEIVLLQMRSISGPREWNVHDVRHVRIDQNSPWHVGLAISEFLLGRVATHV